LQYRFAGVDGFAAVIDQEHARGSLGVAGNALDPNLVSVLTLALAPDDLEASAPAAVLNSDERARFDAPMQPGQAGAAAGHVQRSPFLNVDLAVRTECPDRHLMLSAFPLVSTQFHLPKW